jgi:hypothetical protein
MVMGKAFQLHAYRSSWGFMKTTTKIYIVLVLLTTTACATVYDPVAEKYAADAADGAMAKAIWAACEAPTIGAVKRRFPNPDDMLRYLEDCTWARQ